MTPALAEHSPHGACGCQSVLRALWAKDPEDLTTTGTHYSPTPHLLDTAAAAEALWAAWLRPGLKDLIVAAIAPDDEVLAVKRLMLMAALHDVGKVNSLFQAQPYTPGDWQGTHRDTLSALGLQWPSAPLISNAGIFKQALPGHRLSVARRHEYVGAYALRHNTHLVPRTVAGEQWLATAVAGHHGLWRIPENPYEFAARDDHDLVDRVLAGGWGHAIDGQRHLIEATLGIEVSTLTPMTVPDGPGLILVSGLLMLADWLASHDDYVAAGKALIKAGQDPVADPSGWLGDRQSTMPAHLESTLGSLRPFGDATSTILGGHPPRPLQEDAIALGGTDGLWLVAFPTGEGKTKAAQLRHVARPGEHLLFGLPTTATTDAMTDTLRRDFHQSGNTVVKSHQYAAFSQTNGLNAQDADLYADSWYDSSLRRLFAPIAVTTCDQVLASVLRMKNSHIRLLAIANHHVVLDEVHTFDAYQRELLNEVLAWLGATNTRTTLLSASIPRVDAQAYRDAYLRGAQRSLTLTAPHTPIYPGHTLLAPADPSTWDNSNTQPSLLSDPIAPVGFDVVDTPTALGPDTRANWALTQAATHPRCHIAVVCNQVDIAVSTALLVAADLPPTHDLIVLHSRMTRSQRETVETRLRTTLGPPPPTPQPDASPEDHAAAADAATAYRAIRPVVVIATQIIEASLDLDFDLMCSDLAPAPSLVQRAGRLWRFRDDTHRTRRHGDDGPARRMTVVATRTDDGDLSSIGALPYAVAEIRKVLDWITNQPVLVIPDDVQPFIDTTRVSAQDFEAYANDLATAVVDAETSARHGDEVATQLGSVMQRIEAAAISKAPVLKTIIERDHITYRALVDLTARPDDEAAMRTRFTELPTYTFLIFDSRAVPAEHAIAGPVPAWAPRAPHDKVAAWQAGTLPASGRAARDLLALHKTTLTALGLPEDWTPRSATLKRQYPVDLAHLDAQPTTGHDPTGRFDDTYGWINPSKPSTRPVPTRP